MIVLVDSWNAAFHGSAAQVLLQTICTYLDTRKDVYARYSSLTNSSGTGKSRMVDEVGANVVTISMCLREEGATGSSLHTNKFTIFTPFGTTTGFPPADKALRDWLTTMTRTTNIDQTVIDKSFQGLLTAILSVTQKNLETIQSERNGDLHTITAIQVTISWCSRYLFLGSRQSSVQR